MSRENIKRGSGNLFADLGQADPDTHLLKAELVTRIRDIVEANGLTQTLAADRMGLSQPDVSRLFRGHFRDVSIERLMKMLTRLGCDVDIVVRRRAKARRKAGSIQVHAEAA